MVKRIHRTAMDMPGETLPCSNSRMIKVDMTRVSGGAMRLGARFLNGNDEGHHPDGRYVSGNEVTGIMTENIPAGCTRDPACLHKSFSQLAEDGVNIFYRIGQEQGGAGNDHDTHGVVQGQNDVYVIPEQHGMSPMTGTMAESISGRSPKPFRNLPAFSFRRRAQRTMIA